MIYQSKVAKTTKTFDALDWLAQLVTHIPDKGESSTDDYLIDAESTLVSKAINAPQKNKLLIRQAIAIDKGVLAAVVWVL